MKKPIFILALFCIPLISAGQSGYSTDTAKVNALLRQSIDVEGDTVFSLLQTAQNLARGAGYTTGEARALMYEGIELEEIHDYPGAVPLYQQALTLYSGLRDSLGIAKCYANLGAAFYRQGENEKGVEYWNLARPLFQRHGQNAHLIVLLNNVLSAYTIMGKPEKALLLADTALAIAVQLEDTLYQAMILNNLGMACEKLERWEQAETIYRKSLAMFNALGDTHNYCRTLSNIADVLNKTGRSPEAWAMITADSANCLVFDEPSENTVLFYRALSDAAKGIGEYKTALEYHALMKAMDDSIYTVNRSEKIREVEAKYQNELIRKEKTIQQTQLHNQRIALWSVAGALLLIMLLAMSIWRGKRRSDGLLANILPLKTIRELKRTGSVQARRFESASVLFTDFKGFTQISEQLTPEQLVHEIDRCFKAFDAIIDRHAVEKIKTIGDRKSTRLNSSHSTLSRMPSSA